MVNPTTDTVRIIMVEDYKLVRFALKTILNDAPDLVLVNEYTSAEEALADFETANPHVILMDLGLPGMSGIEATKRFKAQYPDCKVLILSSHGDRNEVIATLSAGANGYCLKDTTSEKLVSAIRHVADGIAWFDPAIADIILDIFNTPHNALMPDRPVGEGQATSHLSQREHEVLAGIVQGKNNTQIAEDLCISIHTVKIHVSSILSKLAVNDRVQAAVIAVKDGIC